MCSSDLESQRLVSVVIKYLQKANAPGASDFKRLAASMINFETQPKVTKNRTSDNNMLAPTRAKTTPSPSVPRKQLKPQLYRQPSATMSESDLLSQQEKLRRATMPNFALQRQDSHHHSRTSMDSARSQSPMSNWCETMRVPGLSSLQRRGRSFTFRSGSR